jgi:RND family efflux transporter MFP subunit
VRKVLVGLSVVMVVAVSGFFLWGQISERVQLLIRPVAADPVPTVTVENRAYRLLVPSSGELLGLSTTPVMTPRVRRGSLKVSWLEREGKIVQPGTPLVEFDPTEAQLSLQQSENEVNSYSYQIDRSKGDADGEMSVLNLDEEAATEELNYATGQIRKDEEIFSRWEIQESLMSAALAEFRKTTLGDKVGLRETLDKSNLKILSIDQQKARVEMEMAQDTLSALTIDAPASGVLIYQRMGMDPLEVGAEVWPGQPILEIAQLDKFRAKLQIPEKDVLGISPGQNVSVVVESFPNEIFTGKVDRVARIAQQVDREDPRKYFECNVLLDVPLEFMDQLKPGMTVKAEIELGDYADAIVLPRSSVTKKDELWVVFVSELGGFREQAVEIIGSDHGFYMVKGIDPGTMVCLRDPFQSQKLVLPDFNAPAAPARMERFVIYR